MSDASELSSEGVRDREVVLIKYFGRVSSKKFLFLLGSI